MGREFYRAVTGDPEMGVPHAECEEMCYFFAHLSRERFGNSPIPAPASLVNRART